MNTGHLLPPKVEFVADGNARALWVFATNATALARACPEYAVDVERHRPGQRRGPFAPVWLVVIDDRCIVGDHVIGLAPRWWLGMYFYLELNTPLPSEPAGGSHA
jgi:hypothetical protein